MTTHTTIRGMDHVGMTVLDIEEATRFFMAAFDAEIIYESLSRTDPPGEGTDFERLLSLAEGTRVTAARMLRLGTGPGIELWEMQAPEQAEPARPSDLGFQHIALYVDDIVAAASRFEAAGGVTFGYPIPNLYAAEAGQGNQFVYGRTPWGSIIEFITYPSRQPYEEQTTLRRWRPNG